MAYCENCGALLRDNARFCEKCGQRVAMETSNTNTVAPTPVTLW